MLLPPVATNELVLSPCDNNSDLFPHILSFVGKDQFRFIAAVNRSWKDAYTELFPHKKTILNASTVEHAKICWDELGYDHSSNNENCDDDDDDDYYRVGYEEETLLCRSAAKHGNLAALQFLRRVKCRWNERTCKRAAQHGHLAVLQWCRANGCPWNEDVCAFSAKNGHFNVLKWCRENGAPWDSATCSFAAEYGDLHILQWCRKNGCPWSEHTCSGAAKMVI